MCDLKARSNARPWWFYCEEENYQLTRKGLLMKFLFHLFNLS